MTTYRQADIKRLTPVIAEAAALWSKRCNEFIAKNGDIGTCVIGAHLYVDFLPPRCRNSRALRIINAPGGQGSLTWEGSLKEVCEFLRFHGVEAHYNPGFMD